MGAIASFICQSVEISKRIHYVVEEHWLSAAPGALSQPRSCFKGAGVRRPGGQNRTFFVSVKSGSFTTLKRMLKCLCGVQELVQGGRAKPTDGAWRAAI